MTRVCPFCGSDLPPAPDQTPGALTQTCPTCNQEVDLPQPPGALPPGLEPAPTLAQQLGRQLPPSPPPPLPPAPRSDAPAWEGESGFLGGLWRTTWQVLFSPTATFAAPALPDQRWALTYSLLMGTLGGAAYLLWEQITDPGAMTARMGLLLLVLTPLQTILGLYLGAGLTHLMLLMVGGAKRGFHATFRVLGYGNAAAVWLLIPWLGLPMSLVWSLAVMVSGLAAAHGISRGRAFWAGAVFFLLLAGLALILALGAGLLAMLAGSPWWSEGLLGL